MKPQTYRDMEDCLREVENQRRLGFLTDARRFYLPNDDNAYPLTGNTWCVMRLDRPYYGLVLFENGIFGKV